MPASGRDLMISLDVSGSMERKDYGLDGTPVRRIDAVKEVADRFLAGRRGDRVGLVAFSEEPYLAALPTFDIGLLRETLAGLQIGMLGRSTAIGDGLGLALKQLEKSPGPTRVVLLLSDGTSTAGKVSALAAAELANRLGIKVHTVALAAAAGSADTREFVDIAALAQIAAATGGEHFASAPPPTSRTCPPPSTGWEPSRAQGAVVSLREGLWIWPAGAALVVLLASLLLPGLRWAR
ncbi:von Willebrand factor type A domain protein [Methylobrevis pamukkalensis]|uniref:von Willebrand factor type A domain protein n=1 Tax=Methylobrevis pamukkalensis TaxID=1439726 RepID=A0A1E3GPS8_9HYPH|nr:von Willebrand factor type A domain protein [Methylobrevis pamukkalensis]